MEWYGRMYVVWLACLPREFLLELWCLLEQTEADQAGWKKICVCVVFVGFWWYLQIAAIFNKQKQQFGFPGNSIVSLSSPCLHG